MDTKVKVSVEGVYVSVLLTQLFWLCDPLDCSPPGFSVHGILQARILEWITMPSSRDLPDPGIEPASLASSAIAGRFFSAEPPGKPNKSTVVKIISK